MVSAKIEPLFRLKFRKIFSRNLLKSDWYRQHLKRCTNIQAELNSKTIIKVRNVIIKGNDSEGQYQDFRVQWRMKNLF